MPPHKRRGPARPLRLVICAAFGLALAAALALQATSSVLTRKNPEYALRVFPLNGLAAEEAAYNDFLMRIEKPDDLIPAARASVERARATIASEALTPRAHGLIALAETDQGKRDRLLAAASALNRRDLFMQGIALERFVQQRDFSNSLATLDRLLRVHPEQKDYFFGILTAALRDERSLPAFAEILDGSSDWHRAFLLRASRNPEALGNLTRLRALLETKDNTFDRELILRLANAGRYADAYAIYREVTGGGERQGRGTIPWTSDYAPFDWQLTEGTGLRGFAAPGSDELEVFVRRGEGGIVAQRVIAADPGGFAVELEHRLAPADQVRDVRLQLRCDGSRTPFYDERFELGPNRFEIGGIPAGCDYLILAIHARAWSSRSQLRGTIGELRIEPL